MAERSVEAPLDEGGGDEFKPFEITCVSCAHKFLFSVGEQKFYKKKGLAHQPKRCRSCRFARKAAKAPNSARPSTPTPATSSRPPPPDRATYSLPIVTFPGLVLESDRKSFVVALDPGKVLRVWHDRQVSPGTYVAFTRSTTKGNYLIREVLGSSPPPGVELRMKASIVAVDDGQVSLRVHFNNAVLTCAAPSFDVSTGMRVLFSASWSEDEIQADRVTGPDDSYRSHPPSAKSAWNSHFDPLSGSSAPSFEYDIIHPSASVLLARALGYTHDLRCRPELSPAPFAFPDDARRGAVPKLSLLRMEELASPGSWSGGLLRSPAEPSESEEKSSQTPTYLLLGTRPTGHILAEYLRKNFTEIDSLGLERRVVVLYPVDEGVTPDNFLGTVNSKLFQPRLLPIRKIEVLSELVPLAQVRLPSRDMTGRVTSQRMVAVHYELSAGPELPPFPPVTWLESGPLSLDQGSGIGGVPGTDLSASTQLRGDHDPARVIKFSIPKGALELDALRGALPQGTLLHPVGHAMASSYTTFEAVFATLTAASNFVNVIGEANRSHKAEGHWLAAPLSEFWGGDNVYTLFTSKSFQKDEFYKLFNASWAFAVNHTQIRFSTEMPLREICAIVDRRNFASRRGLTFFRLFGDHRGFITFARNSRTSPRFPGGALQPSSFVDTEAEPSGPGGGPLTFLHNLPRSLSLSGIHAIVHALDPGATAVGVAQSDGTLSVSILTANLEKRGELLAQPSRKLGRYYLFLSDDAAGEYDSLASRTCSGPNSLESIQAVLGGNASSSGASALSTPALASSRPDTKESAPSSSSSPALTGTAPQASSSAAGGKSASGASPVEQLRPLPSGLTSQLASRLPSVATNRPDLVNFYLDEYTEEALCDAIRDPTSLTALAREITDYVRDEIAGENSGEEEDSLMQIGQGHGGSDWAVDSLSTEGSFVPDTQETTICDYDFSETKEQSQEQTQLVLTPDERSSKKRRNNECS